MNFDQNNLNMQCNNEIFNKLKILNKIDAVIEFICALCLVMGMSRKVCK